MVTENRNNHTWQAVKLTSYNNNNKFIMPQELWGLNYDVKSLIVSRCDRINFSNTTQSKIKNLSPRGFGAKRVQIGPCFEFSRTNKKFFTKISTKFWISEIEGNFLFIAEKPLNPNKLSYPKIMVPVTDFNTKEMGLFLYL